MNLAAAVCVLAMTTTILGADSRGYVLEFSGQGCVPCQQVAPIISKLEREGLPIQSVDCKAEQALANQYGVDRLPTFILIIDGHEVERVQGAQSESAIRRMLAKIPGTRRGASGPLDIELGASAPLPRPEVRDAAEARPKKPSAPKEKSGLGIWPLPLLRGEKAAEQNPIYRGNDSGPDHVMASSGDNDSTKAGPSDPMASSVRIRVITGDSLVRGSGTVIESQRGKTTLITCGHLFRNAGKTTKVEVDLFVAGEPKIHVGTIVGYDLSADIGLVTIPTAEAHPVCPLVRATEILAKGTSVASIGCSGGDPPSREQLRITKLNEFEGPETISCTGVPVQGRSGGGLFNERGELIGVCFAADKQGKGGVYCGRGPILDLLQKYDYGHLIPSAAPAASTLAEGEEAGSGDIWSQGLHVTAIPPTSAAASAVPAREPPVTSGTAPSVEEFTAGDAEVVIFIKTRTADGPQSKVILIQKPSRSFLKFVEGEVSEGVESVSQSAPHSEGSLQTTGLETRLHLRKK